MYTFQPVCDETFFLPIYPSWGFFLLLFPADFNSCWGDYKNIDKEGLWGDYLRWCRPICLQLCLLSLPSLCRTKWDKVTLRSCASLLNHRWGDPNAICSFLVGGTCYFMLVDCIVVHLYIFASRSLYVCFVTGPCVTVDHRVLLKCFNKHRSVFGKATKREKNVIVANFASLALFFDVFQKVSSKFLQSLMLICEWNPCFL